MTQYLIKLGISAAILVAVSELSKRSSLVGGLLASLPLTSLLAMLWLFHDTKDVAKVAALSSSIFWLVLPSLVFFAAFPLLIRAKFDFSASFAGALAIMLVSYSFMIAVLRKLGVHF